MNVTSFAEFSLAEPIFRAIQAEGYERPTPIQAAAIPHLLAGRDLLGCAQTGTGKTAAFALPILHRLDQNRRAATPHAPRVLVLSPTRELAAQIGQSFATYGRNLRFRHTVIFGGVGQQPQVRALARGVHVLIATPGRLLDLMEQRHLRLDGLDTFVLDEADRMLDMGFLPDLKKIIAHLPRQRQSLFFSATMPSNIADLANKLLTDPVRVNVTPPSSTVELIEQRVMYVEKAGKRALLHQVLSETNFDRALVFTRTKHGADKVVKQLVQGGIHADAIHGNKSQSARERTLQRFRSGALRVLVATDLAARGIDVAGISHVINYDLPQEPESYVHRIGRTGRAGATGIAMTFCESGERGALRAIERLVKKAIDVDPAHVDQSSPVPAPRQQAPSKHATGRNTSGRRPSRPQPAGSPTASGRRQTPAHRNRRPSGGPKGGRRRPAFRD